MVRFEDPVEKKGKRERKTKGWKMTSGKKSAEAPIWKKERKKERNKESKKERGKRGNLQHQREGNLVREERRMKVKHDSQSEFFPTTQFLGKEKKKKKRKRRFGSNGLPCFTQFIGLVRRFFGKTGGRTQRREVERREKEIGFAGWLRISS